VRPRLRDDAGRFDQHPELAEPRVDLHREARIEAIALGREARETLDAAFRVAAVAAHVPFADRAARARDGIWPANDADDPVARLQAALGWGGEDPADGLVSEGEPRLPGRGLAELAAEDLPIGAAHADGMGLDEDVAVGGGGVGQLHQRCGVGLARHDGESAHRHSVRLRSCAGAR
jgi:hypothetical protein